MNKKDKAYESLKRALADDEDYIYNNNSEDLKGLEGYKDINKLKSE